MASPLDQQALAAQVAAGEVDPDVAAAFLEEPTPRPVRAPTLADQVATGEVDPEVAEVFAEEELQNAQNEHLRLLFEAGLKTSPDRHAGIVRLSERSGLAPDVVEAAYDNLKAQAAAANFDPARFRKSSPELVKLLLERPELAPTVMGDDSLAGLVEGLRPGSTVTVPEQKGYLQRGVEALGDFFKAVDQRAVTNYRIRKSLTNPEDPALKAKAQQAIDSQAPLAALRPLKDVQMEVAPEAALQGADRAAIYLDAFLQQRKGLERSKLGTRIMARAAAGGDTFELEKERVALEQKMGAPKYYAPSELEKVGLDVASAAASQVESLAVQGAAGIAGRVVGGAVGALAKNPATGARIGGFVAKWGSRVAGFANSFDMEAGGAYLDFRNIQGPDGQLSNAAATGGALVYGLLAAAVEVGATEATLAAFGPGAKYAAGVGKKEIAEALTRDATFRKMVESAGRDWAKSIKGEAGEEAVQDGLQKAIGYLLRRHTGDQTPVDIPGALGEIANSAAVGGIGAAGMGPVSMVVNVASQQIARSRMLSAEQQIAAIQAAAKSTRLAQASPEALAQVVEHATEEAPVKSLFVDPEAILRLYQDTGADLEQAATDLMGEEGPQRLARASHTGQLLEVPVAEWVERWASKPIAEQLVAQRDVTTRRYWQTGGQLAREDAEIEAEQKENVARFRKDVVPETETEARWLAEVHTQLMKASEAQKLSPEDATDQMAVVRAGMRTMARRFGMSLDQTIEKYGKWTIEAAPEIDLSAFAPAAAKVGRHWNSLSEENRAREHYLDPITGAFNEKAWEVFGRPDTTKPLVARISIEGAKHLNDKKGHEALDGAYKAAASGLYAGGARQVFKIGGDLVIRVADRAELDAAIQDIRKGSFWDQRYQVTGHLGATIEESDQVGKAEKDELRRTAPLLDEKTKAELKPAKARQLADRSEPPLAMQGLQGLDAEIALNIANTTFRRAKKITEAEVKIPQALLDALAKRDDATVAMETYVHANTGLLTNRGWERIKRKDFVVSLDLRGLKALNEHFTPAGADLIMDAFGLLMAQKGGADFDIAHLHGDEYALQGNNKEDLEAFLVALEKRCDNVRKHRLMDDGKTLKVLQGVQFAAQIGKSYDDADNAINRAKELGKLRPANAPLVLTQERDGADAIAAALEELGQRGDDRDLLRQQRASDRSGAGGQDVRGVLSRLRGGAPQAGPPGSAAHPGRVQGPVAPAAAPASEPTPPPRSARVFIKTPAGAEPAHYEVREASELIPSHDALSFAPRADYPAGAQERVYDVSKSEQAKVARGAAALDPSLLLSDIPTATDGPPIIAADRPVVLGGNGRTMMIQHALAGDSKALEGYRADLLERAAAFGLDRGAILRMTAPVLVRVAEDVRTDGELQDLQRAVRRFNEGLGHKLSGRALGVAESRQLSDRTIGEIGQALTDLEGSLRDLLRLRGSQVIDSLRRDKIVHDRNQAEWITDDGELTAEGKLRVEGMFLGQVLGSYERIEGMSDSLSAKVERAVPHLIKVLGVNSGLDEIATVRYAVDLLNAHEARRARTTVGPKPTLDQFIGELDLYKTVANQATDAERSMASLLHNLGQKATGEQFARWAEYATDVPSDRATGDLFGGKNASKKGDPQRAREVLFNGIPPMPPGPQGPDARTRRYHSGKRGMVDIIRNGEAVAFRVLLTPHQNLSTFLHETGHIFLTMLALEAERPGASQQLRDDWAAVLRWVDASSYTAMGPEQHEKFARGFERYLRAGRAPSVELRGAFRAFARWLKSIYRRLADGPLRAEISPEISGVFDRILATDEEIEQAKQRAGLAPMFRSPEEAGMSPSEWKAYLSDQERATEHAAAAARLDELKAKLEAVQEAAEQVTEDARQRLSDEYDRLQASRAVALLAKGHLLAPDATRLGVGYGPWRRDEMVALLGEERTKALEFRHEPKWAQADSRQRALPGTGPTLDDAAELLGYPSAQALARDLDAHPGKKAWVESRIDALVTKESGALLLERERLQADVEKGLHGDATAAWLAAELAALRSRTGPGRPPRLESIQRAARELVDGMSLAELENAPGRALQAERRASARAQQAMVKGNFEQAFIHKHQQILNHYVWKEATAALADLERLQKLAGSLSKAAARERMGKASPVYRDGADTVLEALGFAVPRQRSDQPHSIAEVAQQLADDGINVLFDPQQIGGLVANPRPWRVLTVPEGRAVLGYLKQVQKASNDRHHAVVDGQIVEKDAVVDHLAAEAAQNLPARTPPSSSPAASTLAQSGAALAHQLDGELLRTSTLVDFLGGQSIDSWWHRAIFKPLQQAKAKEYDLLQKAVEPIVSAFRDIPAAARARLNESIDGEQLFPDHRRDIQPPTKRFELLMLALNLGNEGNKQRVLEGRRISEDQAWKALELLTAEEWNWVQSVWDACESLWPMTRDLEERVSGLAPEKIPPVPFTVQVGPPDARKPLTLRGGYFPAVYDRRAASNTGERQALDTIAGILPNFSRPGTPHSHTKQRAEQFADVIVLDPSVLTAHLAQVTHDLSFREALRSVGGLVLDQRVQAILKERLGPEWSPLFLRWLKDVGGARGADVASHDTARGFATIFKKMRANLGYATLGYAADIALGDLTNLVFPVVRRNGLKARHWAAGLAEFATSPLTVREEALQKSGELRTRSAGLTKELRQHLDRMTSRSPLSRGPLAWFKEHAFAFMEATDVATSTPIWWGAYRQGLADLKDEAKAIEFADKIVRDSFPSFSAVDQSPILRDKGMVGSLVLFHGYFNVVYQAYREAVHPVHLARHGIGKESVAKATAKAAATTFAIAAVVSVMGDFLTGRGPEPDDGDDDAERYARWSLRKLLLAPLSAVPFAGAAADVAAGRKPTPRDAPGVSVVTAAGKAVWSMLSADEDIEVVRAAGEVAKLVSMLTGIPGVRPIRAVTYSVSPDGAAQADDVLELLSGLLFGDRGERQPATPLDPFEN